jgi:hypothetical protein
MGAQLGPELVQVRTVLRFFVLNNIGTEKTPKN